jgi:hypothetical protein
MYVNNVQLKTVVSMCVMRGVSVTTCVGKKHETMSLYHPFKFYRYSSLAEVSHPSMNGP